MIHYRGTKIIWKAHFVNGLHFYDILLGLEIFKDLQ